MIFNHVRKPPTVYGETVRGFLFFIGCLSSEKYFLSGIEEHGEIL